MRIYTKTTKVLGVTKDELDILAGQLREAAQKGHSETQIDRNTWLAIEVSDMYEPRPEHK